MQSTFKRKGEKINGKNKLIYIHNHNKCKLTKTTEDFFDQKKKTKKNSLQSLYKRHT